MKKLLLIGMFGNAFTVHKIGVLVKWGAPAAMKQWRATTVYLSGNGEKIWSSSHCHPWSIQ